MGSMVRMVKGDAGTPQRFWLYVLAADELQVQELMKMGYVKSNLDTTPGEEEDEQV